MLRRLNRRYPNQWIAHTWLLPLLILLSCAARIAEAAGMCAMLAAPESMRAWAESV